MATRRCALLITLVLLSGCAAESPAPDDATTTTTTTTAGTTTPLLAPPVRDPVDATAFAEQPCTSLTEAQLSELGLGDAHDGDAENVDQAEDNCTYFDSDPATGLVVYVNYYPADDRGLSGRYLDTSSGNAVALWSPTEIDGHPAVAFRAKDYPWECHLDIGLSDTSIVNLVFNYFAGQGYNGQDTCAQAGTVGAAVLATIKSAG